MKRTLSIKPQKKDFRKIIKELSRVNIEIISIKDIIFNESENLNLLGISLTLSITLQIIDIHECYFSTETFNSLILYIVKCPSLGWLFLKNNKLTDEHVKCLTNKLSRFETLICLNLSDNLITKNGVYDLCNNIFKCPTLQKVIIDEEYDKILSTTLKSNCIQIEKFHKMVLNFNISDFKFKLDFFPTLINSYYNNKPLLHYLVVDDKYTQLLFEILEFEPNPYLTDIIEDKNSIRIATPKNKEIIENYIEKLNFGRKSVFDSAQNATTHKI